MRPGVLDRFDTCREIGMPAATLLAAIDLDAAYSETQSVQLVRSAKSCGERDVLY
jgi:hypothetical protein